MTKWLRQWKVPSSDGAKTYLVSQGTGDSWACSCPHWKYRCNGSGEVCKHIEAVMACLDIEEVRR